MAHITDHIKIIRDTDKALAAADPARLRRLVLDDFVAALNGQFADELRVFVEEMPLNNPGFPYADVVIGSVAGDRRATVHVDLGTWGDMCEDVVDIFRQASHIGLSTETEKGKDVRLFFTAERQAASCRVDDCLTDLVYFSALERTP